MTDEPNDDRPARTFTLLAPGSVIFEPDGIHQVVVQFPDAESAIVYFEWLRQLIVDTESAGYEP